MPGLFGTRRAVSREDVLQCYRTFLNRLPESEAVLERHARTRDLWQLVGGFAASAEFLESTRVRASQDDVAWCYRTFVGREATTEEVASLSAANLSIRALIEAFLASAEFRDLAGALTGFRGWLNARHHAAKGGRDSAAPLPAAETPPAAARSVIASLWPAHGPPQTGRAERRGPVTGRSLPDAETAARLVGATPWHHDFELVPGVRTHGSYDPRGLWEMLELPDDLSGISVADVGASSGYFSFESCLRGAAVTAFDIRHRDNSGFGLAQYINGLDGIAHHQVNVLSLEARDFGQFDIVLCLGLLYHTSDPYLALRRCADLARSRLLVESHCSDALLPHALATADAFMKFWPDPGRFPSAVSGRDSSNFWSPTSRCLEYLVADLGFSVNRLVVNGDRVLVDAVRDPAAEGRTRHGVAYGLVTAEPRGDDPNDPAAWKIF